MPHTAEIELTNLPKTGCSGHEEHCKYRAIGRSENPGGRAFSNVVGITCPAWLR